MLAGRPIELGIALILVLALVATGGLLDVLASLGIVAARNASGAGTRGPVASIVIAAVSFLIILGLCFLVWRKANWARYLLVVLTVPGVLAIAYRALVLGQRPLLSLVAGPIGAAVVVLLLVPRVNAWMR